jgi:hypothetical protein
VRTGLMVWHIMLICGIFTRWTPHSFSVSKVGS